MFTASDYHLLTFLLRIASNVKKQKNPINIISTPFALMQCMLKGTQLSRIVTGSVKQSRLTELKKKIMP